MLSSLYDILDKTKSLVCMNTLLIGSGKHDLYCMDFSSNEYKKNTNYQKKKKKKKKKNQCRTTRPFSVNFNIFLYKTGIVDLNIFSTYLLQELRLSSLTHR